MRFMKDIKRPRRNKPPKNDNLSTNENDYSYNDDNNYTLSDDNINNSLSNDNYNDDNDSVQFHEYQNMGNIKQEFESEAEIHSVGDDEDEDNENDLYSEQLFKEAERLQQQAQMNNTSQTPAFKLFANDEKSQGNPRDSKPSNSSETNNCKCSKRTYDQVHFLEDLEKEEQNLIKSTRLDITRSDNLAHVGDSDYNFLVSFLPQMKKMSELQNLQFRAKMTDIMLNIMTPSISVENKVAVSSSQTGGGNL